MDIKHTLKHNYIVNKNRIKDLLYNTIKYTYIGGCLTLGYYGIQSLIWLITKTS